MVKALSYFRRRPELTVEAFQDYWRSKHPEVVTRLPGIRGYVQSHTLIEGYRKARPIYDGIAEVWFEDTAAMRALAGTPAMRAVEADEAKFIDRSTMGLLIVEDHVVKSAPAPAGGVKNVEFVTRRPGMEVDAFQRYWRETHGPLAATIPVIRRYVQSHVRRSAYEGGRRDLPPPTPLPPRPRTISPPPSRPPASPRTTAASSFRSSPACRALHRGSSPASAIG